MSDANNALGLIFAVLNNPTDAVSRKVFADLLQEHGQVAAAQRMQQLARFAELLAEAMAAETAGGQGLHWPIYDDIHIRLLRPAHTALERFGEERGIPPEDRLLWLLELTGAIPGRP
jgi:uncharacterized protein (TIGR02996 family)